MNDARMLRVNDAVLRVGTGGVGGNFTRCVGVERILVERGALSVCVDELPWSLVLGSSTEDEDRIRIYSTQSEYIEGPELRPIPGDGMLRIGDEVVAFRPRSGDETGSLEEYVTRVSALYEPRQSEWVTEVLWSRVCIGAADDNGVLIELENNDICIGPSVRPLEEKRESRPCLLLTASHDR